MKIARKEIIVQNGEAVAVQWDWADGEVTRIGLDELNGMESYFLANGVSQKFGDAYSGTSSVHEARVMLLALKAQVIDERTWARKGGNGGGELGILAEALIRVMEDNPAIKEVPEYEAALAKVKELTKEEIKALKKRWPSLELEMDKIKIERKAAKVDGKGDDVDVESLTAMFR